jgi:hypothetical protein
MLGSSPRNEGKGEKRFVSLSVAPSWKVSDQAYVDLCIGQRRPLIKDRRPRRKADCSANSPRAQSVSAVSLSGAAFGSMKLDRSYRGCGLLTGACDLTCAAAITARTPM